MSVELSEKLIIAANERYNAHQRVVGQGDDIVG